MKPIRVALIPSYQPDDLLTALVKELSLRGFFLIVIDDGSGEDYAPILSEISGNAVVLTHDEPLGRETALQTGMTYLKEHFPFPYTIVTIDGDGKHRICDAEHLCMVAEENRDALVMGARIFPKKTPLRVRFSNRMHCLGFKLTTGVSVRDLESGLIAFSDQVCARMLPLFGDEPSGLFRSCAKAHIPMPQVRIQNMDTSTL